MIAHYDLLVNLYQLDRPALDSVYRGMKAMAQASEPEWCERFVQMSGAGVDETWGLEPRLELFLLQAGFRELDRWVATVKYAARVGEKGREEGAWEYAETSRFLENVLRVL
jgi:hypothetical protein